MSSPEHKEKIWNLIKDIKIGMLTTIDDDTLRSRPMQLVQDAYDGTLWFFTDANDHKVKEIKEDNDVNLSFSDPQNGVFVSMSGSAKLTKDKKLIDRYWNDYVSAWYKEGKKDDSVAMLEIKIQQGEHWNNNAGAIEFFYEIEKAKRTKETPNVDENEKF